MAKLHTVFNRRVIQRPISCSASHLMKGHHLLHPLGHILVVPLPPPGTVLPIQEGFAPTPATVLDWVALAVPKR